MPAQLVGELLRVLRVRRRVGELDILGLRGRLAHRRLARRALRSAAYTLQLIR